MASPVRQKAVIPAEETDLSTPPWWTEADQADLSTLTWELVDGIFEHRPKCASCAVDHPPCPHIRRAIEVVIDWRQGRELQSRARWLRRQRELLEYERDVLARGART